MSKLLFLCSFPLKCHSFLLHPPPHTFSTHKPSFTKIYNGGECNGEEGTEKRQKVIKPLITDLYVYIALRRLRASSEVEEDIEEMRAEERAQQSESSISIMELICSPTLRAPLIIGIVMQLSQQLSGINAVSASSVSSYKYLSLDEMKNGELKQKTKRKIFHHIFHLVEDFIILRNSFVHSELVPSVFGLTFFYLLFTIVE